MMSSQKAFVARSNAISERKTTAAKTNRANAVRILGLALAGFLWGSSRPKAKVAIDWYQSEGRNNSMFFDGLATYSVRMQTYSATSWRHRT